MQTRAQEQYYIRQRTRTGIQQIKLDYRRQDNCRQEQGYSRQEHKNKTIADKNRTIVDKNTRTGLQQKRTQEQNYKQTRTG